MSPEQLHAWRTKHKLSRLGLAKIIKSHPHTIYQWEKGMRAIPDMVPAFLVLLTQEHLKLYQTHPKKRH
jgi:DNA-binding transcriptional regulator YiaG